MKYILISLFFITILFFSIIFSTYNNQIITVHYLISNFQCPLSILIMIVFIIGFLVGILTVGFFYINLWLMFNIIKKENINVVKKNN